MHRALVSSIVLILLLAPGASAQSDEGYGVQPVQRYGTQPAAQGYGTQPADEGYGTQLGWGLATVGANVLYIPAKLVYAAGGGIIGALSYAITLGNSDAAERVWSPALGGTYVLSPAMVRGEEPILFSGESYARRADPGA